MPTYTLEDLRSIRRKRPTELAFAAFAADTGSDPQSLSLTDHYRQMFDWSTNLVVIRRASDFGTPVEGWTVPELPEHSGDGDVPDEVLEAWGSSKGLNWEQTLIFDLLADKKLFQAELRRFWAEPVVPVVVAPSPEVTVTPESVETPVVEPVAVEIPEPAPEVIPEPEPEPIEPVNVTEPVALTPEPVMPIQDPVVEPVDPNPIPSPVSEIPVAPVVEPEPEVIPEPEAVETPTVEPESVKPESEVAEIIEPAPVPEPEAIPEVEQPEAVQPVAEIPVEPEIIPEPEPVTVVEPEGYRNYTYTEDEDVENSGFVTVVRGNIEAIRTLKLLEAENREATDDEKEILARYNGFGGVKKVFDRYLRYSYTPESKRDLELQEELKKLTTDAEYESLERSVLNAHYTPVQVCRGMWELAKKAGFKGGKVFDTGFGIGRIEGAIPEEFQHVGISMFGVELDGITARIAQKLFPQATIVNESVMDNSVQNGVFDLMISNPPFDGGHFADGFNLHNYCLMDGAKKLKPGGIMVVMVTQSTMDNNPGQRERLAELLDLEVAYRLPNDAMKRSANTEVVTDILVFRKTDGIRLRKGEPWLNTIPVEVVTPEKASESNENEPEPVEEPEDDGKRKKKPRMAHVNEYFVNHPDHVLGSHSLEGSMYGNQEGTQYTVLPTMERDVLWEKLDSLIGDFQLDAATIVDVEDDPQLTSETAILADESLNEGEFDLAPDGRAMVARLGYVDGVRTKILMDPDWRTGAVSLPKGVSREQANEIAWSYVQVKKAYNALIWHDMATQEEDPVLRENLNAVYDAFVEKHGRFSSVKGWDVITGSDPQGPIIFSLELASIENGKAVFKEKAAIFRQRTVNSDPVAKCETIPDAILLSMDTLGRADAEFISNTLEQDVTEKDLLATGMVFRNPATRKLETSTLYLSGDVVGKLEEARIASKENPEYSANVLALARVQPERIPIGDIGFSLASPWMPNQVLRNFAYSEDFRVHDFKINRSRGGDIFVEGLEATYACEAKYGVPFTGFKAKDAFEHAVKGKSAHITIDGHPDQTKTADANSRIAQLKEAFRAYVFSSPTLCATVEDAYNHSQNRIVEPRYDGSHLTFPLLRKGEGAMVPRPHQCNVVARKLEEMCGMIPHKVGYGKTFELLLLGCEIRRVGKARKPLIVADNPSYAQFVATAMSCFPTARILYSQEGDMSAKNRNRFMGKIANNDWDLVIMAQSHFNLMPNSPETHAAYLSEELAKMRQVLDIISESGNKRSVRNFQKKIVSTELKLERQVRAMAKRQDRSIYFEDTGIDFLMVDEVHNYKRVPFQTSFDRVKGIDQGHSKRGLGLLLKARVIQNRRGDGTGVIGATGTPISNTLAEAWNMKRLTSPKLLQTLGVESFDNYVRSYCDFVTAIELNEASLTYKEVTRLNRFKNGHSLIPALRSVWDVKMDDSEVTISNIPTVKNGKGGEMVPCKMTASTDAIMDLIEYSYAQWQKMDSTDKADYSYVPLVLMAVGTAASVDPRLVNPYAPDDPDLPVNKMIDNVVRIHAEKKGEVCQVIFADKYRTMSTLSIDKLLTGSGGLSTMEYEDMDEPEQKGKQEKDSEQEDEDIAEEPEEVFAEVPRFNLYEDMRSKLLERGFKPEEVVVVTDLKTDKARKAAFARMNAGEVKIMIGSTKKLGQGVNIQEKLYAAHHMDPPSDMTHSSLTQRNGRIIRQRNNSLMPEVEIYTYGVEGSTIPAIMNRLQKKGEFSIQLLSGKSRSSEFEDPCAIDVEEQKSMLIRDPRAQQLTELKREAYEEHQRIEIAERMRGNMISRKRSAEVELEETLNRIDMANALTEAVKTKTTQIDEDDKGAIITLKAAHTIGQKDLDAKLPVKEFNKLMKERIAAWQEMQISWEDSKLVGQVKINGMNLKISKGRITSGATALFAQAVSPLDNQEFGGQMKFGSPDALIRCVNRARDQMLDYADSFHQVRDSATATIERLSAELEKTEIPSRSRLESLKSQTAELERDIVNNPVSRRDNKIGIDVTKITSMSDPRWIRELYGISTIGMDEDVSSAELMVAESYQSASQIREEKLAVASEGGVKK